jgi:hypothetical protein
MSKRLSKLDKDEKAAEEKWKQTYLPEVDEPTIPEVPVTEPENKQTTEEPTPGPVTPEIPQATAPVAVEAPVAKEPPKPEPKEDFEQKYKTLMGKYNAEVPRLHAEIKHFREMAYTNDGKIATLETRLEELETERSSTQIDADLSRLKMDFPEVAEQLQKERTETLKYIKSLEKKINETVSQKFESIDGDKLETNRKIFNREMASLGHPDWTEVDHDPDFIEWLQLEIPFANITRLESLQNAAKQYDAVTCAKFFTAFKEERQSKLQAQPAPVNKLEDKIAPPSGKTGGNTKVGAQTTTYTKADYDRFYRTSSRGRYNPSNWGGKTEAETEALLDKLMMEGKLL